jgi:CX module
LAAAAGTYVGYKVIKAGSHLLRWGDRDYYFGNRYYPNYGRSPGAGQQVCVYNIDDDDDADLRDLIYEDRSPVRDIYFECPSRLTCCGMECSNGCSGVGLPGWGIAL